MRQRGPRLGRDHNDGEGAASGARLPAAGSRRGCRTNQHHPRLLVRLPQGHDFGESHFGRGEPRPAGWVALTRSAEMAVVKFVQGVWFVRQPPSGASVARDPSALSLAGFGCLPVAADPSKRRCLGECWVRRLRTRGPHRRALARERKGGKRPRHAQFRLRARAVISAVRTRPLLVVVEADL